jgi:hypothetical protein
MPNGVLDALVERLGCMDNEWQHVILRMDQAAADLGSAEAILLDH